MAVHSIVLVDESSMGLPPGRLQEVAQALQVQVVRDFQPVWHESARVTAATTPRVPAGAWQVRIVDESPELGVHTDRHGHPFAIVRARADWTITASHELLEMLVDPEGERMVDGADIDPDHHRRQVQYLVEVCDPCQAYDYPVGTVPVSDFVTPEYYRPAGHASARLDFLGRIGAPLEVPRGGHLSWWDPQDRCWQERQADGRFLRDVPSADAGRRRDDRDQAVAAAAGGLRHDPLAARRAMFRELVEAALDDLFTSDPRMRQIVERAAARNGWGPADVLQATREYRRHLLVRYLNPGIRVAALNKLGDLLWHEHIIDTGRYREDCDRIFGALLDHQPFYEPPAAPPEEDPHIQEASRLYRAAFNEAPPEMAQTSY